MTPSSTPRRGEVLRAVIAAADRRRDGLLPMDVPGVAETFGDERTLLGALSLRWYARLAGRIERALAEQPLDLEAAVIASWQQCASELPGVLAILDAYRRSAAGNAAEAARGTGEQTGQQTGRSIAVSAAKEHELMAVMAGQGSPSDPRAARVGERLVERARATMPRPAPTKQVPLTFAERLKAVLSAA